MGAMFFSSLSFPFFIFRSVFSLFLFPFFSLLWCPMGSMKVMFFHVFLLCLLFLLILSFLNLPFCYFIYILLFVCEETQQT